MKIFFTKRLARTLVCGLFLLGGCAQGGGGGEDSGGGSSSESENLFPDFSEIFEPEQTTSGGDSGGAVLGTNGLLAGFGACATQDPDNDSLAQVSQSFNAFLQNRPARYSTRVAREDAIIPVYFHVIRKGPNAEDGNLTDEQLNAQVDVLNRAFSGQGGGIATPFRFALGGINRVDRPEWFTLNPGTQEELDAKTALHTGGPDALNIYTANLDNNILGYASFPFFYFLLAEIDGIVIQYRSVPGGNFERYNTGLVAVHEVGHWLGLLHTFQGECDGFFGDLVSDTPSEKLPGKGEFCPVNRDSCASDPGPDPVHNHMTYTEDSCRFEFTQGQLDLMLFNASFYRGLPVS